ncbi:F-box only protein 34 [Pteropus medius]|uniref:F-box only protein 34 n=1 Tax=Pteropus vampyrus TaxID=132908 RepID=UPI00196B51D5|nr:F-box only protein 34 [Pteropus giganteus]XP_039722471.1 F-box only protein 34 [Pteropus giganteus]XP_039722472.1 F-box only protein 34 [Pteropus giganteus]XP_039722473.1 F-box only protein 34 [Pteropus giganteus]XP_039722475.1 F-box only protein 34 [Pteropus giganteus]XP_039722476.1 F-box only protein 34 [Pteropus giganteus]XP_039722477.1 F-box only protein 34 [Pteropus giganteus]XP_039722478.1 F-box only protein 34 [Pteropus giganteus]XP_039722479.1 F-box only protein 34 [Pteropus giga
MHLKPYWKLQKKARPLEISTETLRTPMSHQEAINDEKCRASYMKPGVFPSTSPGKASSRKPFGILSPNVLCSMSGKSPVESSLNVKTKKNAPSATIHQGEEGEGPLDIWAVVKPGNTKEKIAFFAAHQCSNRIGSMKIKSSWDIDGRATKRRKKSGDLKKAKIQLERMREVNNSRCYQPEPFACGIEHCSVHYVSDSGDGVYAGRPLSVVQMVAFLEQRASALLASCAKNCTNSPAMVRFSGQSRSVPPASEPFSSPGACEEPTERGNPEVGEPQSEPVRVLDMVARLESECLKRQSHREPGSLSRNNSFRRNVGRVLLANGTQADESKTIKGTLEAPDTQVNLAGSVSVDCGSSRADHCSLKGDQAWDGAPRGCPSLPAGVSFHMDSAALEPDQQTAVKNSNGYDVEMTEELVESPVPPHTCPQAIELPTDAVDCVNRELVPLTSQNPDQRRRESVCISITVSKVEKDQPSGLKSTEDPLPGMLFFLPPGEHQSDCPQSNESATKESSKASQLEDAAEGGSAAEEKKVSADSFVPPASPVENTSPVLEASSWKKQVSHDFLETRFKIQQLLEPQQYMAFLPHHIMVKIFRLLPTKSLVALKCTCCYFKFIIEYYNIRPADSRWVRDPRYREDPCKQCKKKYVKGDVSLCRWHPKPYCQALPYGPGYWMCCHRSQKGFPGCKLGLHDNHWVPACHSFNRAIHKKAKGTETEEEY